MKSIVTTVQNKETSKTNLSTNSHLSLTKLHIYDIDSDVLNPLRSGRIPKLSQHVIRAAANEEEEDDTEDDDTASLSPTKPRPRVCRDKRNWNKHTHTSKFQLFTLRASDNDEDDDEEEEEVDRNQQEMNNCTSLEEECQVFVPMGLRAVPNIQAEVEETMEEVCVCVKQFIFGLTFMVHLCFLSAMICLFCQCVFFTYI